MLFTSGWAITEADEQAIRLLPATAWKTAVDQDGAVQQDKHVAKVTHLMRRAGRWPAGLRWVVRRHAGKAEPPHRGGSHRARSRRSRSR